MGLHEIARIGVFWGCPCLWLLTAVSGRLRAAEPLPPQAELVFEDRFDKPDLDAAWRAKVGEWTIADGALRAQGPDAFAVLDRNAGTSMRLEYTAWSDDPCDLSACLNLEASATRPSGVFFQFGGMHNRRSAVVCGGATLWEGAEPLIQPGVKHRVVCERWGPFARFTVDGKVLFHGVIPQAETERNAFAGLFIYNTGHVDDVRLYRFVGDPTGDITAAEPELKVRTWLGFEEAGDLPQLPPGWSVTQGAGTARVALMRDYRNSDPLPRWLDDHCLELASPARDDPPRMEGHFEGQERGLVEFEALVEDGRDLGASGFELSLLDAAGRPAAVLATDEQRRFFARGPDGPVVLDPPVAYTGINPKPPLRFAQGRWFRVRVHFDAAQGRFTAVIVGMYVPERSYNPFPATGHWFVFGKDVPFARPAEGGQIAGLTLALAGGGRLRLDNLYCVAPTNGLTVGGKDVRKPARELLGTAEHPRHDPLDMLLYSLRETLGTQGQYGEEADLRDGKRPEVLKAAFAYDDLLVRQALLQVGARGVQRARSALAAAGKTSPEEVESWLAEVAAIEQDLAGLYRAYLDAYLDGLNDARMTAEVAPLAQRLGERLTGAEIDLAGIQRKLGTKPVPDRQPPLVRLERGRYRTDAGPALFFPQTNWLRWPEQDALLRLDGCPTVYGNVFFQAPQGSFIDTGAFERYVSGYVKRNPDARFMIADVVGLHSCYTLMPDWWLKEHQADDDVFLCDATGKVPLKGENRWESDGRAQLNFWNPTVRAAMRTMATERARYFATRWPGRVMGWEVLQEAHSGAGFAQTGYNQSAQSAFRERLRKAYGTIQAVNERWGTQYGSFDEIVPPAPGAPLPSGLNYEFQRFRQEGYRNWIADYAAAVKAELPDVPVVNRIVDIVPYPTDHTWSFDFTVLYPVFDYFEFHTSMGERLRLSDRMMTSLRRAFGGESGIMEWGLGSAGELFDELGARRATEAEFFRLAAGGRSLFNVWYGIYPGWADCANWSDPRWSHTTLRYSAASIPVSITRLRAYERRLLDYPQVEPRLNILESSSSFLNATPIHGPRSRLVLFAQTLEAGGYDYGFLWEDLVLAGKQDLRSSEVLLLPCATCLAEPVQEWLAAWIGAGGRAVAIAPPGVYDPWGRPSGKLLSVAFPGVQWSEPRPGEWEPQGASAPAAASHPVLGSLCRARLGKGELLVFTKVDNNARPTAEPALLDVIKSLMPRQPFYAADNRFELTLRRDESGGRYILTALNGDLRASAEDEVHLRLPVREALDVEIGVPLPMRRVNDEAVIPLTLAPGEGVVIELRE